MRPASLISSALLGALLAAGAWWLLSRSLESDSREVDTGNREPEVVDAPTGAPDAPISDAHVGSDSVEPLDSDARTLPVAPLSRSLVGRVVSAEDGAAIEGALVEIALDLPGVPIDSRPLARTETAGDGRFEFSSLPGLGFRARASHDGHLDATLTGLRIGSEIEFRLEPGAPLACRIERRSAYGVEPIPECRARLQIAGSGWTRTIESDRSGMATISGVTREQLARAAELGELELAVPGYVAAAIELPQDPTGPAVLLSAARGTTIAGRVVDSVTGAGIEHSSVTTDGNAEVETDHRGRFRIHGAERWLLASAAGYTPAGIDLLARTDLSDLSDPPVEIQVTVELDAGLTLHGRVLRPDGTGVGGAEVLVDPRMLSRHELQSEWTESALRSGSCRTDANGNYRLDGIARKWINASGNLALRVRPASSHGWVVHYVHLDLTSAEFAHDVVLPLGNATGSVRTAGGEPASGARVSVASLDGRIGQSAIADESGDFQLIDLPAGRFQAAVEHAGATRVVTTLSVPSERLEFSLDPTHAVRARIGLGAHPLPPGFSVAIPLLDRKIRIELKRAPDDRGIVEFGDVPRGAYPLRVLAPSPHAPFLPYPEQFETRIHVGDQDWEGDVEYPIEPAGTVLFSFAAEGGASLESVEIAVLHFRGGLHRYGSPSSSSKRSHRLAIAREEYRALLRPGDYLFRFRSIDPSATSLESRERIVVRRDEQAEAAVVLRARSR